MQSSLIGMLLAGAFFGAWPLIMRESNLGGMAMTAVFVGFSALIIIPSAGLSGVSWQSVASARWQYAIVAAVLGSVGLILMNQSLSAARPEAIAGLIIVMVMMQVVIPALYHAYLVGGVTIKMVGGVIAAAIAVILLA